MMSRLGDLEVECWRAEFDKYAAAILLLHGLWTGSWIWRAAAGYLAHRGWNCHALAWRGAATTWAGLLTCAQRAAEELERPVVIGHDLGALAALQLCGVRAAVALSPLACGAGAAPHPLARGAAARLARWRGADIRPRDGEARRVLGVGAALLAPESSRWLGELERLELGGEVDRVPRLVAAGDADACLPAAAAEEIARRRGAELKIYEGAGHDQPYGPRWQAAAADTHRWLVQQLGESLLRLRGDEDLRDE
jgi:pimeloyl-ACP methyl ester carboxylesterase